MIGVVLVNHMNVQLVVGKREFLEDSGLVKASEIVTLVYYYHLLKE